MRTRPWPLVLLALTQILTPIANLFFNAWALKVSPFQILNWITQRPFLEIFEALFLMPVAGLAILRVRRWSYSVFFAAMIWSIYKSLKHWAYAFSNLSPLVLVFIYLLEILLVLYFLMPEVRTAYFDPSVRWWESKPRYELKIPAALNIAKNRYSADLVNISEGGAFVSTSQKIVFSSDDLLILEFSILSQPFLVNGKIVHHRDLESGLSCYGVQFSHTAESQRKFQKLTRGLEEIGFQERSGRKHWWTEFKDWLVRLIKTGRGWHPEPQYRSKPQSGSKS